MQLCRQRRRTEQRMTRIAKSAVLRGAARGALPSSRGLALPVLDLAPAAAAIASPALAAPAESIGDPFSPHKILAHFDRLQRVAAGEFVYPITVEIDPTNVCNHRCQWCVSMEAHTGEIL